MSAHRLHRHARLWLLSLVAWTCLGLLSATQNAARRVYFGRPVDWGSLLPVSLADWLTCGMFTPAFAWMVDRFPIRGERWWSSLPAHVVASLAFVVLKVTAFTPLLRRLDPGTPVTWTAVLTGGFYADLLAYWATVGILHAVAYYRESRSREVEAARLEGALRVAELENLRAQLQPHFLFNTLQSISTLIHRDPVAADRMLTELADLLRISLRHAAAQEVPLRDELGFLDRYVGIMRARFGDRLAITVDAAPATLDAMVPSLVLQPLVENAIRHGMAGRADAGRVSVRAVRENGALRLEVEDDGPGLAGAPTADGNGVGLANTRGRLARLYGAAGGVETVGVPGRGLTVRVTVPFRTSA